MKKSFEEVKVAILTSLEQGPLSIQKISEDIKSNWATTNKAIEDLKQENKIKEVVETEKIRIYKLTDYPVFYGIPLPKSIRDRYLFIFSEIIKEWKKQKDGEIPISTALYKTAVDVVEKCNLALPVLHFHYGLVSPVAIKPEENLETKYKFIIPKNSAQIISSIKDIVKLHSNDSQKEEDIQYDNYQEKYNLQIFKLRKKLVRVTNPNFSKLNKNKIENLLLTISMEFPNSKEEKEIYPLFDTFLSASVILLNSSQFKDYIKEIKECFEGIWDLLTTHLFFKDARNFMFKEALPIFNLIRTSTLNTKQASIEERILNLESISNTINISEIKMPMDEESITIRKILTEGAEYE